MHGFITLSDARRHMINEVFVIEIDKMLLLFLFLFFAKPGRLADLCLFQSTTMVMASG